MTPVRERLQVLTNKNGNAAALRSNGSLFDVASFYIANPNKATGLSVTLTPVVRTHMR
jgi:hypothetical protein